MEQKRQVQVRITRTPGIKIFQIQGRVRDKLVLQISTTAVERIHQAPDNVFLATDRKRNRKVLFLVLRLRSSHSIVAMTAKRFSQTIYY